MKLDVEYRKEEHDNYAEIEVTQLQFCCDEMKEAWENDFVGLADYSNKTSVRSKTEVEVNIYKCYPYPEGAAWDGMEIEFCPFCGKEIELNIKTISKERLEEEKRIEKQMKIKQMEIEIKRQREKLDEMKRNLMKV
jgi:hypothetical protein